MGSLSQEVLILLEITLSLRCSRMTWVSRHLLISLLLDSHRLSCLLVSLSAQLCLSEYTGGPQDLPGGYDGSSLTIPGGYPFTTQIEDPDDRDRKLNVEIQNGRAAMLV